MTNLVFKYGIIGGVIVSLLFLGPIAVVPETYFDPASMASGQLIGYTIMILSMLCVFFGVRRLRKLHGEGAFSFGKALLAGIAISLVASVVFYLGNVLIYQVIAPDFLSEFSVYYKEYMLEQASSESERQEILREYEANAGMFTNSYAYAGLMAATTLLIGLVISLISAIVLKSSKS